MFVAQVGIREAAPAVTDLCRILDGGRGEENLVALYLDVGRMEHAIVGGNLEALCAGEAVCMVETQADVVVFSSDSRTKRRAFALQLMAVGVFQGLQGKALAYRTFRAVVNVIRVA